MPNMMSVEGAVSVLVESMLPRNSGRDKALLVSLDVRVSRSGSLERANLRKVHMIFWRPANYTLVGWNVSREWTCAESYHIWGVRSDHDSCWRNDGISAPLDLLIHGMLMEWSGSDDFDFGDYEIDIKFDCPAKLVQLSKAFKNREKNWFTVEYAKENK